MNIIKDSKFWSVSGISGTIDSVGPFVPQAIGDNTGTVGIHSYVRIIEQNKSTTIPKIITLINCDHAIKPGTYVDLVVFNIKEHESSVIMAVRKNGLQSDDTDSMLKFHKLINEMALAKSRATRLKGIYGLTLAVPAMITIILGVLLFGASMYLFYLSSKSKRIAKEYFESLPSKEEMHKFINLYMSESAVKQPELST
jgi:hypothetical protein